MAGTDQDELFVGVDVGGTNIATALVSVSGRIVARRRARTPRKGTGEDCLATVGDAIEGLLAEAEVDPESVGAIGLAIAGVVDPAEGRIVVTPNMNLTGLRPVDLLKDRLSAPIALGNDVDVGTLGEVFLGVARGARNVVGMFIGTGIGGGVVCDGRLVRGARDAAGEVGHMVMEVGGPLCGCGNRGCLEAIASRTAIERDVRAAVDAGRKTRLKKLLKGDFSRIRSGALRKALRKGDELTMEIVQRASEVIGHACLTVRHLLDPEVIVLGGGVMEACEKFMMPIIEGVVEADALPGARPGGCVVPSELGDDAGVLGAAVLAMESRGLSPGADVEPSPADYPAVEALQPGRIVVGGRSLKRDCYVRADGKVKKRKKRYAGVDGPAGSPIGPVELSHVCARQPTKLVVGTGFDQDSALTPQGEAFLRVRGIGCTCAATPEAVRIYHTAGGRKAALFRVEGRA